MNDILALLWDWLCSGFALGLSKAGQVWLARERVSKELDTGQIIADTVRQKPAGDLSLTMPANAGESTEIQVGSAHPVLS